MKKFLIGIVFLLTYSTFAQTKEYQSQWDNIDALELDGKVASANELTESLIKKAYQNHDFINFIKAKLYHYRLYQINHESSDQYILKDINSAISRIPAPFKNVLRSYKAKFLMDFYSQNRWNNVDRSQVLDKDNRDLKTWSLQTLRDTISFSLKRSLDEEDLLIKTSNNEISELLSQNLFNRKFQPSLFDLFSSSLLNFYQDSAFFTNEFGDDKFNFPEEKLFALNTEFYDLEISLGGSSTLEVLKQFQKLERDHDVRNEIEPLVYWKLERLKFAKNKLNSATSNKEYMDALMQLSQKYKGDNVQAMILYEMAYFYYKQSDEAESDGKLKNPDYLIKAVKLLEVIASDFANTATIQNAIRLKTNITSIYLDSKIQEFLPSDVPGRIFISYKNIDTLYYKIFPISSHFFKNLTYRNRDLYVKEVASKIKDSIQVILPGPSNYNTHSTEIAIDGKPYGNYLVYLYSPNGYSNYGKYVVTDLAVSNTTFNTKSIFSVTNRKTGKKLDDVKLQIRYKDSIYRTEWADENGEITVANLSSNNRYEDLLFINKKDTLDSYYHRSNYRRKRNSAEPIKAKTLFFLDRAIYRPGQKVYFKGVLLQHENDSTSIVANEYVEVYVDDPNRKEIQDFRFKTNEFGSFTGSFNLPKSGVTGKFKIYAEEDIESETEFWEKISNVGDFNNSSKFFSVEEYKRPTFEVAFDTVRSSFKLRDSVKIAGNAKSYVGAAISGAVVKYEITREQLLFSWWTRYYSNPVIIKTDSVFTKSNGNFEIDFIAEANKQAANNPSQVYRYTVNASVTDITGETRTSSKEIKIGNKNLIVDLDTQKSLNLGDTLKMYIKSVNLNDNKVPISGKLNVFKLKTPSSIFKDRWWEAPEYNLITKEKFHQLFPNEPYGNKPKLEELPKSEMIYQSTFKSDGEFENQLKIAENWKEGNYLIELQVQSENNETISKAVFQVRDPKSKYLASNNRIAVKVINRDRIKTDGFAKIRIQTPYKDLHLKVAAYSNRNTIVFKQFVEVDGTKIIKIPITTLDDSEFKLQITGVRDNSLINHDEIITFKSELKPLKIEIKTFRNKIQPGLDETWSFSIYDSKNKSPEAEVLASMYDASLDQFKTSIWNTETNFENNYTNYPYFKSSHLGNVKDLNVNYRPSWGFRPIQPFFDELKMFGLSFGGQNSWYYRHYLNQKKKEEEKVLNGNIKGKVVDEKGMPLPGVNIIIKNSTSGTQTDFDGDFAIEAEKGDVLVISYIGFKTLEYIILNESEFFIVLEQDSAQLDEVVQTGVAEVTNDGQVLSEAMLLQGKVAGVELKSSGASDVLMIRGNSSLNTSATPLIIVDGNPVTEYDLNSSDIVNVEILKGFEATALYGAKAIYGAVLITTKAGIAALQNVEARKNLDETAFFLPDLKLDENGKIEFSFTSPEALTRWKLRLLAHTKKWNTGNLQKTVITQKELNVVPNPPRFLREGDTIIFKSKISNLSQETMSGNAVLKLFNAVTMQPIDKAMNNFESFKSFKMNSSESEIVSWKLVVSDTIPAVTYRILAKAGDFSDGEENLLPVLKNKMLVKESIPFFVRAGETENYVFENLKNQNSNTLKNHQFTIEYSSNPAWYAIQSLPYLMEYEHNCSEQLFSRIFANSVGNKIVTSQPKIAAVFNEWRKDSSLVSNLEKNEDLRSILLAETPWVIDAESETAQKKRVAELFNTEKLKQEIESTLSKLYQMQNPSGAFPWFSNGRDNFYITRTILTGFGQLEKLDVELDSRKIIINAIKYLDSEFLRIEKMDSYRRDKDEFYRSNFALTYLYARSFYLKNYPLPNKQLELARKVIQFQKNEWLQKSLHTKGILALVLNNFDEEEMAKKILNSLKESAVYSQDYGMYWKENESSWNYSRTPVETQAMLIEAFSEVLEDEHAVEEMKIWLLQNKRTTHWSTTKSTTAASYALLMKGRDWLSISDNTNIKLGNEVISAEKLEETIKEVGTGYLKVNWNANEVDKSLGDIQIENNNSTAGYGGAYWQYFEDLDKIKDQTESPLNVEKELYLKLANNKLKKVTSKTPIKSGDLVTVRLVVRSKADMDFIHLKDMRASGFEPTDVLSEYKYQDGTGYYQSTRDAATHFFFDSLRKGTYVLEYTVRANNAGSFSNGITLLESMYAPEFSAHTKGIRVEIRD